MLYETSTFIPLLLLHTACKRHPVKSPTIAPGSCCSWFMLLLPRPPAGASVRRLCSKRPPLFLVCVHTCVRVSVRCIQVSMRRLTGAIRNHVLNPTCSATDEAAGTAAGEGYQAGRGRGAGAGAGDGAVAPRGGRCWIEPFVVDIRYDTSTEQVGDSRLRARRLRLGFVFRGTLSAHGAPRNKEKRATLASEIRSHPLSVCRTSLGSELIP